MTPRLVRLLGNHWLPVACTSAALALWTLAAVHGYAWQMIWLPAAVAGAAWPHHRTRMLGHCLRRRGPPGMFPDCGSRSSPALRRPRSRRRPLRRGSSRCRGRRRSRRSRSAAGSLARSAVPSSARRVVKTARRFVVFSIWTTNIRRALVDHVRPREPLPHVIVQLAAAPRRCSSASSMRSRPYSNADAKS
jgi:hypothetical protein